MAEFITILSSSAPPPLPRSVSSLYGPDLRAVLNYHVVVSKLGMKTSGQETCNSENLGQYILECKSSMSRINNNNDHACRLASFLRCYVGSWTHFNRF